MASQYNTDVLRLATSHTTLTTAQLNAIFMAKGLNGAELESAISAATLATAQKGTTASTLGLKEAFQGLWAILKSNPWIGILTAMAVGTIAFMEVIDHFIITAEEQIKINNELKSSYDELISNQNALQNELDETNNRISELQKLDNLSLVEKSELENLKLQNTELSNRLALLKEEAAVKSQELNAGIENAYKKDFQEKDIETLEPETFKTGSKVYDAEKKEFVDEIGYTGRNVFITEEELFNKNIARAKELIKLGEKRTVQENEELKSIRKQTSEVGRRVASEMEGYNAQTDAEKAWKKARELMIDSSAFVADPAQYKQDRLDNIWNSEEFEEYKNSLLELDEISTDALSSNVNYKRLMEETGATADEVLIYINSLAKHEKAPLEFFAPKSILETVSQLDTMASKWKTLDSLYSEFSDKDFKYFSTDSLAGFIEAFRDIDGINIDSFLATLSSSSSSTKDIQNAFNNLATEYIFTSHCLEGLTDATANQIINELEAQGVTNASAIVMNYLAIAKEYAAETGNDLSNATSSEIIAFLNEANASEITKQAIAGYTLQKELANGASIYTDGDIENLASLVGALGATNDALLAYNQLKQGGKTAALLGAGSDGAKAMRDAAQKELDDAIANFESKKNSVKFSVENTTNGAKKSNKGSNSPKEQPKEFNWLKTRNEYLQKEHDSFKKILDDETQSYEEQIDAIDNLIAKDKERLEASTDALTTYQDKWAAASAKLSQEDIDNIMYGNDFIGEHKGQYAKDLQDAADIYREMISHEEDIANLNQEEDEHLRKQLQLRGEIIQAQQDEINSQMNLLQSRMDLTEARGGVVSERMLQKQLHLSENLMDSYQDKIDNLYDQISNVDPDSAAYHSLLSQINDCESAIIDCQIQQEEWNEKILRLPIERIQKYLNMLAGIKQDLQNFLDEQFAMGINPTADQLQQLFDISQEEIKSLLKQQGELKNLLDSYTFGSEKFNDVSQELQDIDNTISGLIQSQKEWNTSILQIPVDQMSKLNDTLNLASSTLDDILSDYDSALSAVTGVIDKQTESLEDLKSTAEKSYQAQIDPLQEELDLLQKQNEERQTQLDLEQRQYDLDRARNQKSTQVIRNGEMIYEADADAIRSASQGLADAQYNKLVKDLEDQISALESERDNLLEGYDSQIEKLNEIKEKWSSIVDDIQMAADLTKADNLLGQGWQDQILSGNDDAIYQLFQGLYENTSSQKTQLEEQTASNERIAEMMNQFAARYQEGSISYEQAMAGIQTLAQQMQDGYSSLEQLNTLLGLNGVDNLEFLLQNMESSANASVSQFSDYMTIVKANADAMAQYTSSWSEMQQNIKDQIAALQKLAEETAKAAEATRQSYTGSRDDSSSKNNISNGTIYADGTTTITNEHVDGFYTGNTGPGGDRESDYINSGPGVKYHDGLKNGPVGSSTIPDKDTKLKLMGLKKLAPGEIASLLRKSEVVLTPEQQLNNLQNLATAWNFTPRIPDYSFTALLNQGSNTPVITVQMGDIKMDHVQDPDGFAKALFRDAEPVLRQQFSKIFRN